VGCERSDYLQSAGRSDTGTSVSTSAYALGIGRQARSLLLRSSPGATNFHDFRLVANMSEGSCGAQTVDMAAKHATIVIQEDYDVERK